MSLVALARKRSKSLARWERQRDRCHGGYAACWHHRDYPGLHVFEWDHEKPEFAYSSSLLGLRDLAESPEDIEQRALPSVHAAAQCGMQLWSKKYLSHKP